MNQLLNQMSEFEFISVLISIIVGLGVTHLISGAGRSFYRRKQTPIDEVQMVLAAATLLILVLNWWVTFSWRATTNWSFEKFLVIVLWTISLYLLAIFLYPPDISELEEHRQVWEQNRVGYYSAFVVSVVFDILQTADRGSLFHPVWYLPFVSQYIVLAGTGAVLRRRGYDRFFAWYLLLTVLIWSLVARRFLDRIR